MRSLRARVFLTVAVMLSLATAASGLLSRRATLVEEQQLQFRVARPGVDVGALSSEVQRAFASGGWAEARGVLLAQSRGARLLAVDAAGRVVAASDAELAAAEAQRATEDGTVTLVLRAGASMTRLELNGVPVFTVRDASGAVAGRVYVLPPGGGPPLLQRRRPLVPQWLVLTIGTAVVALVLTLALSGRILRPVSRLTDAVRRMHAGDLDVRVEPEGDDEIARLGRAFNAMAERLAETERMKRQMVGDIAHELRSPVTNLRCGLESIQDGLAAPDAERIDALHSETLLLQRLIGDLQDLALAESGGLTLRPEAVEVAAVARRAIGDGTSAPPVSLHVDGEGLLVRADAVRLEQMIRNLVLNARQHTPLGGRVEVRASRADARVRLSVADNGRGIAPEHLGHVFDRFYRVDSSRDRATGGAGLGLAIVRRLAEAQGGSAWATSGGLGQGATFIIELPAAD